MTNYIITKKDKSLSGTITLSASKSESNRTLIIQALCSEKFLIENLSDAKDTVVLQKLLNSENKVLDVGPAGTTMRFMAAYLSCKVNSETVLTGSERMLERPIGPLTEALKKLGAEIEYTGKKGFPPLKINGKKLSGGEIAIPADISSQFITALLLIAPELEKGITLKLEGKIISASYIKMTLKLMEYFGVKYHWSENIIKVANQPYHPRTINIEPDWSAASYWYSFAAFSAKAEIFLKGLKKESLQGDAAISEIMQQFGVFTTFGPEGITITKSEQILPEFFTYDFTDCPDIAQTLAVICAGLNIPARLTGLESLKIKETDRITALVVELSEAGAALTGDDNSLTISKTSGLKKSFSVRTYHDHRMAMSFAPLALISDKVTINDIKVVEKSYPGFWSDMKNTGFEIKEI